MFNNYQKTVSTILCKNKTKFGLKIKKKQGHKQLGGLLFERVSHELCSRGRGQIPSDSVSGHWTLWQGITVLLLFLGNKYSHFLYISHIFSYQKIEIYTRIGCTVINLNTVYQIVTVFKKSLTHKMPIWIRFSFAGT